MVRNRRGGRGSCRNGKCGGCKGCGSRPIYTGFGAGRRYLIDTAPAYPPILNVHYTPATSDPQPTPEPTSNPTSNPTPKPEPTVIVVSDSDTQTANDDSSMALWGWILLGFTLILLIVVSIVYLVIPIYGMIRNKYN